MKTFSMLYLLLLVIFLMQGFAASSQCTTVVFRPGPADGIHAHLTSNHPTQNQGHTPEFMSYGWTILSVPFEARGLMKFDLSALPVGATITSAKLNLYADSASQIIAGGSQPGRPTYGTNNASNLLLVTAPWDRNTVTWNSQPATTTSNEVALVQSVNYNESYLNLDITNFVQGWVNDPNTNYGMMLQLVNPAPYNAMVFASSDIADTTLRPSLEICYIPRASCNTGAHFNCTHLGGGQVQFTNTSTSDSGYYSSWVFYNMDGIFATSNLQNPQITYTGTEPFFASLTVTDSAYAQCFNTIDSLIDITTCISFRPGPAGGYHAHITSLQPSLNYGTVQEFMSIQWTDSSVPYEARGLMKFDLSPIPSGSTIVSALLDLYADSTSTSSYPGQPMYGNTQSSNLMEITSAWDKNTVTWNNQPVTTATNQVFLGQARGGDNYPSIDLSDFVKDWVSNPAQNYGMLLKMVAQNYYNAMIFCSSDYPDSTRWPDLHVCYINGGLNGNLNDSLCGFVFVDANANGLYDSLDVPSVHTPVLVDGVIYYSDNMGYYHVITGAGTHHISFVPPYGYAQTYPDSPSTYSITTTSGQAICGFDFGMKSVPTGIYNINASASNLVIYPNPANGSVFNVKVPEGFETANASLTITDMMGREVSMMRVDSQAKYITVMAGENVGAGIYLVTIKNESKQIIGRVSISR